MYRTLLLLALFAIVATGCRNTTAPEEPTMRTFQQLITNDASENDLYAQAVIASDLYDDLAFEDFPLLLIAFYEEEALEAYIAEQGLSEEEFLAHPQLRDFMEHHLIPSFVDVIEIRSTENGRFTYTSAAGSEVVFTTGEDLTQTS